MSAPREPTTYLRPYVAAPLTALPMTVWLNSTEDRCAAVEGDRAPLRVGWGDGVLGGCLVELVAVAEDVTLVATDPVHESVHGLAQ